MARRVQIYDRPTRPRITDRPSEPSGVVPRPCSLEIEKAKRLDPAALGAFCERYQQRLHAYFAGPRHWHWDLVPDLVQETLARAIKSFPRLQGHTEVQAERWLFGIARNVHLQEVSRQVGIRLRYDVAAELAKCMPQITEAPWYLGDIYAALAELPLSQLEALRLMLEGLTIREIAAALDVPAGTVA
ncbi:MAG: RNA polymerase sigma factor, partial [Deltaproteobacteria bacterium]|nr:RNA polymerase sigma factor [Deltaproteobacteria bacterium]